MTLFSANEFAAGALARQKAEFMDWGVMADWKHPYITSDRRFVSEELRLFQRLYDKVCDLGAARSGSEVVNPA